MFTGIISSIGTLTDLEDGEILKARIHCSYEFQAMAILHYLYLTLSDRWQSFENLQLAWLVKSSFHI